MFYLVLKILTAPICAMVAVFDSGNGKTFRENFNDIQGISNEE